MRNKTSLWKRSLAALLSFVMVLGMMPAFGFAPVAYAAGEDGEEGETTETPTAPEGDYITLPITIRDFAADGMLFEWNEVNKKGTVTVGGESMASYPITENPGSWDLGTGDHTGFRIYDPEELSFDTSLGYTGLGWYCVIVDTTTGNVVNVLAAGEDKTDTYDSLMADGYISVWVWEYDLENYPILSKITEANKNNYRIDFNNAEMYIGYAYSENTWGSHNGTNYTGISYFDAGTDPFTDNYDAVWADCLICDSEGNVIQIVGAGTEKKTAFNAMQTGQFALFATGNDSFAQSIIRSITADNMSEYRFSIFADTYYENKLLYLLSVGENTETYHMADTQGFTFLQTDSNDYSNVLSSADGVENPIDETERVQLGSWNSKPGEETGDPVEITLNSDAVQTLVGGWIRTNLVAPELDDDNKPVYTADTVEFLAGYMADVMAQPWQNDDGSFNTFHVEGDELFSENWNYVPEGDPTPKVHDLADFIRYKIENNGLDDDMGSYTQSQAKFRGEILGKALDTANDIETWCDAAYYLLHYYWRDSQYESRGGAGSDGYGMNIPDYTSLHLVAKVQDGKTYYVFNSGYDYTRYDFNNGAIWNTQTDTMTTDTNTPYVYGNPLTTNRFDPLGPSGSGGNHGYGMSGDTYGNMTPGANINAFYENTNYNLSLEGHAEFIFHYASDLYFTFTGDDDVYLYINGTRVLDVGAAHSIAKVTINLNDVATLCGLKEGEPARFDFFYLERHGSAANFGIETNIQLAESGMTTYKEGYQSGVSTGYNGPVDPEKPVSYSYTVKNTGDATLEHLTVVDLKLDVSLNEYTLDFGDKIEKGPNGSPIENMYVYIRNENDAIVEFYSAATNPVLDDEKLKELLKDGLPSGYSMTLYNFRYTISDADWGTAEVFENVVTTTAVANNKPLNGTAEWKVRKSKLVTEPFHVYNWVNKDLNAENWTDRDVELTKGELIQPVLDANNALNVTNADIVLCNGSGYEDSNFWESGYKELIENNVTLNNDDSITYNSKAPGLETIYYKIKNVYDENLNYDDRVYHFDVITYGVADNVYVLDYGLSVELNGDDFGLRVNDHLTVPQNIHATTVTVAGIQDATSNYGDFTLNGSSLKYTPDDIIDNTDSVRVNVRILEEDATELTKFTGVDMYELVTTAPASVVYYEEYHPGITYVNSSKYKVDDEGYLLDEDDNNLKIDGKKVKIDDNGYLLYEGDTNVTDANDKKIKVDEKGNLVYENGSPIEDDTITIKPVVELDENGNNWVHYETVDGNGTPIKGTEQSADQNSNYGSDPNYENDISPDPATDGENWTPGDVIETISMKLDDSDLDAFQDSVIAALNDYLGYSGSDSNGTVNILEVKETAEVMYFDFVGTGFEIISRTTNEQYAVLNVTVYETDDSGNIIQVEKKDASGNTVYQKDANGDYVLDANDEKIPVMINKIVGVRAVITESKGGDLYQVPIVSITGLDHGNYRVSVKAAGSSATKTRVLYIDGIRIYGPLSDGQALEYYNPAEYQAEIFEIKDLIAERKMTFIGATYDDEDNVYLTDGFTAIENITPDPDTGEITGVLVEEASSNKYMQFGPNNELYLTGDAWVNMVAFILTPIKTQNGVDYPEAARTVQIGAHRKLNDDTPSNGSVSMTYGTDADMIMHGENAEGKSTTIEINTGTEMYYTIEMDKLEPDAKGNYLLLIGTNGSMWLDTTLALTNLKVAGYTVQLANIPLSLPDDGETEDETTDETTDESVQATRSAIPTMAYAFYAARKALYEENNQTEEVKVNENLQITGATLKAAKVARNKAATVTVKAGSAAQTVVVTDANGNEVTATRCTRKVSGNTVTFTFIWTITGTRGEVQKYTVRVYDADGLASVNEETVTVTVG